VLCQNDEEAWVPATVSHVYPVGKRRLGQGSFGPGKGAAYACNQEDRIGLENDRFIAVYSDRDSVITKRPDKFRFTLDDEVVFATALAFDLKQSYNSTPWMQARVVGVDIDYECGYGVYEVEFSDRRGRQTCFIWKDNDQHVASVSATARTRFLDSIEQDCDFEHFDYLVTAFKLDVLLIEDQVIEKTFEFACFGSIVWLLKIAKLDLQELCCLNGGRGFHCRIAQSRFADRYYRKLAALSFDPLRRLNPADDMGLIRSFDIKTPVKTLVEDAVHHRQIDLLSILFCPRQGLAWELMNSDIWLNDNLLLELRDSSRGAGEHEIANTIECFVRFRWFQSLSANIFFRWRYTLLDFKTDLAFAALEAGPPVLWDGSALETATALLHFCRRWIGVNPKFDPHLEHFSIDCVIEHGWHESFRLFVEADREFLQRFEGPFNRKVRVDRGEFLDPKLRSASRGHVDEYSLLSVVDLAAHGVNDHYFSSDRMTSADHFDYCETIRRYSCLDTEISLVDFLTERKSRKSTDRDEDLLSARVFLSTDDETLPNRLKLLEYLVQVLKIPPPSALDVIRWRRAGVLRWLVDDGFVDLETPARRYSHAINDAKLLQTLGEQTIPVDMTLGIFLCFCAIEFDDLQSLSWLLREKGVNSKNATIHGWNIAHAVAYFGRLEIAVSLYKSGFLDSSMVATLCKRKPYQGAYATHIAIEKGFTFVAGVLLKAGCPSKDNRGRDIMHYAKRCGLDSVVEYAQSLQRPLILENNIRNLLCILEKDAPPFEKTKSHLVESNCMDFEKLWDCDTWQEPGPLGYTFDELLDSLASTRDPAFVCWLCAELSNTYIKKYDGSFGCKWSLFIYGQRNALAGDDPNKGLGIEDLRRFASDQSDAQLSCWLEPACTKKLSVIDISRLNPFYGKFEHDFSGNTAVLQGLQGLRAKWLRQNIIAELRKQKDNDLKELFFKGESVEVVEQVVNEVRAIVSELNSCAEIAEILANEEVCYSQFRVVSNVGSVSAIVEMDGYDAEKKPAWQSMWMFCYMTGSESCALYIFLAGEGYSDLLFWLFENSGEDFDLQKVSKAISVAAYMGRSGIVWNFLQLETVALWIDELFLAAMLGSAEAGRLSDVKDLWSSICARGISLRKDPFLDMSDTTKVEPEKICCSLVLTAVYGCFCLSGDDSAFNNEQLATLRWLHDTLEYTPLQYLRAVALHMTSMYDVSSFHVAVHLVRFLVEEFDAPWWQGDSLRVMNDHLKKCSPQNDVETQILRNWLTFMVAIGFEITGAGVYNFSSLKPIISDALAEQHRFRAQFGLIKHQESLAKVQAAVENGQLSLTHRDKGGCLVTHLAAAYDRVDILAWLVESKGLSLDAVDFDGRDVLAVARASNATQAALWVSRRRAGVIISIFVSSKFRGTIERLRMQLLKSAVLILQSRHRGGSVRSRFHRKLQLLNESSKSFSVVWSDALKVFDKLSKSSRSYNCWEALRETQYDFVGQMEPADVELLSARMQTLNVATNQALDGASILEDEDDDTDKDEGVNRTASTLSSQTRDSCEPPVTSVRFTKDVAKWLRTADAKYKAFFVRRLQQLAAGERGRKLAKRLLGTQSHIYESYLEMKSGFRILWTPSGRGSILIWYVSSHDKVSRYTKLIDDSENRSSRQLADAS